MFQRYLLGFLAASAFGLFVVTMQQPEISLEALIIGSESSPANSGACCNYTQNGAYNGCQNVTQEACAEQGGGLTHWMGDNNTVQCAVDLCPPTKPGTPTTPPTPPQLCGNGTIDSGEQCDPGNPDDTTTCDNDCTNVSCGDGHVNVAASEQCDDGNTASGDGCTYECKPETCSNCALATSETQCENQFRGCEYNPNLLGIFGDLFGGSCVATSACAAATPCCVYNRSTTGLDGAWTPLSCELRTGYTNSWGYCHQPGTTTEWGIWRPDIEPSACSASACVRQGADLDVTYDVTSELPVAPQGVVETVVIVNNLSDVPAFGAHLVVNVPSQLTYVSDDGGCQLGAQGLSCDLGTITPDIIVELTIRFTLKPRSATDSCMVTSRATVLSDIADPNTSNDMDTADFNAYCMSPPASSSQGSSYNSSVPATANSCCVLYTTGMSYRQWSCKTAATKAACDAFMGTSFPDKDSFANPVIRTVTQTFFEEKMQCTKAHCQELDKFTACCIASNNSCKVISKYECTELGGTSTTAAACGSACGEVASSAASSSVAPKDVSVTKTLNGATAGVRMTKKPGEIVTYTVTVTNTNQSAVPVTIIDSFPPELEVSLIPPGCTTAGQSINCPISALAPGSTVFLFQMKVRPPLVCQLGVATSYSNNIATIIVANTYDTNSQNNIAEAPGIDVLCPGVCCTRTESTPVRCDDSRNDPTTTPSSCAQKNGRWLDGRSCINGTAEQICGDMCEDRSNDTWRVNMTIRAGAGIAKEPFQPNEKIPYRIEITDIAGRPYVPNETCPKAVVKLLMPKGTVASSTPQGCLSTFNGNQQVLECTLPTFTLSHTLDIDSLITLSKTSDLCPLSLSSSATIEWRGSPVKTLASDTDERGLNCGWDVQKTVSPETAKPGDTVTYNVTLKRRSLGATSFIFFDTLPQGMYFIAPDGTEYGPGDVSAAGTTFSLGSVGPCSVKKSPDAIPQVRVECTGGFPTSPGQSVTMTYKGRVNNYQVCNPPQTLYNQASFQHLPSGSEILQVAETANAKLYVTCNGTTPTTYCCAASTYQCIQKTAGASCTSTVSYVESDCKGLCVKPPPPPKDKFCCLKGVLSCQKMPAGSDDCGDNYRMQSNYYGYDTQSACDAECAPQRYCCAVNAQSCQQVSVVDSGRCSSYNKLTQMHGYATEAACNNECPPQRYCCLKDANKCTLETMGEWGVCNPKKEGTDSRGYTSQTACDAECAAPPPAPDRRYCCAKDTQSCTLTTLVDPLPNDSYDQKFCSGHMYETSDTGYLTQAACNMACPPKRYCCAKNATSCSLVTIENGYCPSNKLATELKGYTDAATCNAECGTPSQPPKPTAKPSTLSLQVPTTPITVDSVQTSFDLLLTVKLGGDPTPNPAIRNLLLVLPDFVAVQNGPTLVTPADVKTSGPKTIQLLAGTTCTATSPGLGNALNIACPIVATVEPKDIQIPIQAAALALICSPNGNRIADASLTQGSALLASDNDSITISCPVTNGVCCTKEGLCDASKQGASCTTPNSWKPGAQCTSCCSTCTNLSYEACGVASGCMWEPSAFGTVIKFLGINAGGTCRATAQCSLPPTPPPPPVVTTRPVSIVIGFRAPTQPTAPTVCGDKLVQSPETCEPGLTNVQGAQRFCLSTCRYSQCSDGIDNDGDGYTDKADGACNTDGDATESLSAAELGPFVAQFLRAPEGDFDPNMNDERCVGDRIDGEKGSCTVVPQVTAANATERITRCEQVCTEKRLGVSCVSGCVCRSMNAGKDLIQVAARCAKSCIDDPNHLCRQDKTLGSPEQCCRAYCTGQYCPIGR